jgi:diguanylate cyclase (GGDEF)-like protein/PAS domain S-box-containing protein
MSTTLRVLVIDDSDDDYALMLRELKHGGYAPIHRRVDTPEALNAALDNQEWDIILGDYTMPELKGMQALAVVRSRGMDVPFIFVSGTIGEDTAVAAMRAGAQDYVIKGNLKRLVPAVERELREVTLRRERAHAEQARRAMEARFRDILTIAADAIIGIDEHQHITIFNQGAESIFGYQAQEILGQPLDRLLPPRLTQVHRRHIQQFSRGPNVARRMNKHGEVFGRRKNGEEFIAEASISKLSEDSKSTYTVILRDITERKRTEQELRLLQSLTQDATEAKDMHAALEVTLRKVCEATGWTYGEAWLPQADNRAIKCCSAGFYTDAGLETLSQSNHGSVIEPGEGLVGTAWRSKKATWTRDLSNNSALRHTPVAHKAGFRAGMGFPVLIGDEVVAVLAFFVRDRRQTDGRLMQLVSAVVVQLGSVLQRKRAEEQLHHMAHHDGLTGLPNRLLFMDRLQQAMSKADRNQSLIGVAFVDLDRFKTINDSLGHEAGDLLLKQVAERLTQCVRGSDTVARLSGDEFTLLLTDVAQVDDVARVAKRVLESFSEPIAVPGHELFTSASIGITLYPVDDKSAEGLLRNADIAMYRAKERGRNTYQFYCADMTSKAHARLALESRLRGALEGEEFLLHYQPVVDLMSGSMTGVEALIRWQTLDGSLMLPDEFIRVAEETGLIASIGQWVLRVGCTQWSAWSTRTGLPLRLAINVSPRQFRNGHFIRTVQQVLKETGFDPHCLDLEITETMLMEHNGSTLDAMRELSAMGVQFSIDDFGTGYSSLGYLKHLPIRRLKIDRSFVCDVLNDTNDAAIVSAIISMAHNLGLQVIAEGVETRQQLEFLRNRGCDAMQGYYYSQPVPAPDLARLLAHDMTSH